MSTLKILTRSTIYRKKFVFTEFSSYSAALIDPQNDITDACASPGAAHVYQSTYDYKDWILGIINA